ncbi:hypothetical protein SUGI_1174260 [Cryptomeria japonica]|nr:hypothetical protein SUGI_1174260 [Cryptomeria japonica]
MDYCSAVRWIRFDEKTSTLYLPQFMVTSQLHILMGSFGAMEVGVGGYGMKPITQFVLLMEELIDHEEDIAVLRNVEVLHNFLGSNKQVVDLFILAKGITHVQGCKAIDGIRIGLHKYTRRKYKETLE